MIEAYRMGQHDYSAGKSMSDNRFMTTTTAYKEWERGWIDAVRSDPLLDEDEKATLIGER